MKRYAIALLVAGAVCALAGIDWRIHDKPIIRVDFNGEPTIELGLRDDGVVVWRKITQTTNSPAERPQDRYPYWEYWKFGTNLWLTNGVATNLHYFNDLIPVTP